MSRILLLAISVVFFASLSAQQVGIGTNNPNNSSVLELYSDSLGLLIPRMDSLHRTSIPNPAQGLLVFQNNGNKGFYYFDGSVWQKVGGDGNEWMKNVEADIYTLKDVGIGNDEISTSAALEISSTSKGFLMPRMTTTQRDAIASPVQGLKIFNTDDRCEDTYDGAVWSKNCDMKLSGEAILSADNWRPRAEFPGDARYSAVSFVINGKAYLGTGQGVSGKLKDFWEYDPNSNVWTKKADFGGTARFSAVGFAINGKGYIGTGFDGSYKNDFWEYDPNTNVWTQIANFSGTARAMAVGFSINGKGYVGTGSNGTDFWEYDPTSNIWTQKANFGGLARTNAVGFSINGKGYIGTGQTASNFLNDLWEFTPAGTGLGTWVQKANFIGQSRTEASGFTINNKAYIGLGLGSDAYNDFYEFDPLLNSWSIRADVAGGYKRSASGFSLDGIGYFAMGLTSTGIESSLWAYNPNSIQGKQYQENIPFDAVDFVGHAWTSNGNRIYPSHDADVYIGSPNDFQLKIKDNTLQAYANPYPSAMHLQPEGGNININGAASEALLNLKGKDGTNNRHIKLESNSSSDNTKIYAGTNFIIENSSASGDFYFRNGTTNINVLSVTPAGNLSITGDLEADGSVKGALKYNEYSSNMTSSGSTQTFTVGNRTYIKATCTSGSCTSCSGSGCPDLILTDGEADGHILVLRGNADSNRGLYMPGNLAGTTNYRLTANFQLAANNVITLIWMSDLSEWREVSRAVY